MSDLRFDKITDQLDEQVICVGQVRLLGTSAAEKVERVDGVGAAELFADGPLYSTIRQINICIFQSDIIIQDTILIWLSFA